MLHKLRWATFDGWPHNVRHTIGNAFRDCRPPGSRRWNRRFLTAGPTPSDAPRDLVLTIGAHHAPHAALGDF